MNLNQTYNYYKDLNLQLHASSEVSNPYAFNITGNKNFGAQCASDNSVVITIGKAEYVVSNDQTNYFFGYSANGIMFTDLSNFGTLNSDYTGSLLAICYESAVQSTSQGVNVLDGFFIAFYGHTDASSFTIENTTFSLKNTHGENEEDGTCWYSIINGYAGQNISTLIEYFMNNVGKKVTITFN